MTQTITLRYDKKTNRVTQTYWGKNPNWKTQEGKVITTTQAEQIDRQKHYKTAIDNLSDSDYDSNIENPVPYLIYNPDTDSLGAGVEIQKL